MTRVITDMEIWAEVRRRVLTGELSKRAACREYEIHWQTLEKILSHSEPAPIHAHHVIVEHEDGTEVTINPVPLGMEPDDCVACGRRSGSCPIPGLRTRP